MPLDNLQLFTQMQLMKKIIIFLIFLASKLLLPNPKDILPDNIKRILIIMTAGIGNMLLFIPTLRAIRNGFPEAKIDLLVEPRGTKDLVKGCPYIDNVLIFDTSKPMPVRINFIRELQKEKYNLTIVSYTSQNLHSLFITLVIRSPYRIGYDTEGMDFIYNIKVQVEKKHEVEVNLDLIRKLGIKVDNKELQIWLTPEDRKFGEEFFENYDIKKSDLVIGMHAGAYRDFWFKRWDKKKFAKLGDILHKEFKAKIILFGGRDEIELCEQIKNLMVNQPIIATGKTTIKQTASLIERCNLFISNDSGLMHLAVAVKIPVVAIFGPTNPEKNAPYGKRNVIVRKNLPCSPCYQMYRKFKCDNLKCLKLIEVEQVMEVVKSQLNKEVK